VKLIQIDVKMVIKNADLIFKKAKKEVESPGLLPKSPKSSKAFHTLFIARLFHAHAGEERKPKR
jgi:hypothetical protein